VPRARRGREGCQNRGRAGLGDPHGVAASESSRESPQGHLRPRAPSPTLARESARDDKRAHGGTVALEAYLRRTQRRAGQGAPVSHAVGAPDGTPGGRFKDGRGAPPEAYWHGVLAKRRLRSAAHHEPYGSPNRLGTAYGIYKPSNLHPRASACECVRDTRLRVRASACECVRVRRPRPRVAISIFRSPLRARAHAAMSTSSTSHRPITAPCAGARPSAFSTASRNSDHRSVRGRTWAQGLRARPYRFPRFSASKFDGIHAVRRGGLRAVIW
jgi:hypothetical protein